MTRRGQREATELKGKGVFSFDSDVVCLTMSSFFAVTVLAENSHWTVDYEVGEISRGEKTTFRGTDPESYITEYT